MRLFSIIALMITFNSFNTWASSFYYKYSGKVYPIEQSSQCEMEFSQVTSNLETIKDFKVVDGGCIPYGEKKLQMRFVYAHPLVNKIERFEKEFATKEQCALYTQNLKPAFEEAKNVYLIAFCDEQRLYVDYLELTLSNIKELLPPISFNQEHLCRNFIIDMQKKLVKYDIVKILGVCSRISSYDSEHDQPRIYFIPEISVSLHFTKSVEFLSGKVLDAGEACFESNQNVNRDFETNNIRLFSSFCGNVQYSQKLHEVLGYVHIDKDPKVETYDGIIYANKSECSWQLDKASDALESLNNSILYKYCKPISKSNFQPIIYYIEK